MAQCQGKLTQKRRRRAILLKLNFNCPSSVQNVLIFRRKDKSFNTQIDPIQTPGIDIQTAPAFITVLKLMWQIASEKLTNLFIYNKTRF